MKKAAETIVLVLAFALFVVFVAWRIGKDGCRTEYRDVQEQIQMESMITG